MRPRLAFAISITVGAILIGCTDKSPAPSMASAASAPAEMPSIIGVWDVALHYDASQAPSATSLDIRSEDAGALIGSFYGTEFEIARTVVFNDELRISFITSDGSGPYASSARLLPDGTLSGQTLSTGRGFLMAWTAERR